MKRKIVQLGHPALVKKTNHVTNPKDPEIQKLIKDMIETVKSTDGTGAGLAANQIGELYRISVILRMDILDDQVWEVLINPKITYASKSKSTYWEGCLSIKEGQVFGQVTRPRKVEIEYLDKNGNRKTLKASNYFAHLVQHEIDHLDGILFTKYISDPSDLKTADEVEEE